MIGSVKVDGWNGRGGIATIDIVEIRVFEEVTAG